jgi:hypothetical protein
MKDESETVYRFKQTYLERQYQPKANLFILLQSSLNFSQIFFKFAKKTKKTPKKREKN